LLSPARSDGRAHVGMRHTVDTDKFFGNAATSKVTLDASNIKGGTTRSSGTADEEMQGT
jgi:hypothetical protein